MTPSLRCNEMIEEVVFCISDETSVLHAGLSIDGLSVCLSIYLSVCQSVCLFLCLSVCLSVYLSVCLSVCLSVHLSLSICGV